MTTIIKTLVLGVVSVTGVAQAALTVTANTQQNGLSDILNPALTVTQSPWDFSGTDYTKLTAIHSITVTLTLLDGDSGIGDFDENCLTLGLDGYDTGVVLNTFTKEVTVTVTVTGSNHSNAVLRALLEDGQLEGSVIDSDSSFTPNWIKATAGRTAVLCLTGPSAVPVPGSLLLSLVGTIVVNTLRHRLFTRKTQSSF